MVVHGSDPSPRHITIQSLHFSGGSNLIWAIPFITNTHVMKQQSIFLSHHFQIPITKITLNERNPPENPLALRKSHSLTPRRRFRSIIVISPEVIEPSGSSWHNKLKVSLFAEFALDQGRVASDGVFSFDGGDRCSFEAVVPLGEV